MEAKNLTPGDCIKVAYKNSYLQTIDYFMIAQVGFHEICLFWVLVPNSDSECTMTWNRFCKPAILADHKIRYNYNTADEVEHFEILTTENILKLWPDSFTTDDILSVEKINPVKISINL